MRPHPTRMRGLPSREVAQVPPPAEIASNSVAKKLAGKREAGTDHPVPEIERQRKGALERRTTRHVFPISVLNDLSMIRSLEATADPRQMKHATRRILGIRNLHVPPFRQNSGLGVKERIQDILIGILGKTVSCREISTSTEHIPLSPLLEVDDAYAAAAIVIRSEAI